MFETAQIACCGRFKFEVRKASNDKLVQETDWMDNVVLDSGLDLFFDNNPYASAAVGTGNSTPVATQTALDAQVAVSTSTVGSDINGFVDGDKPYAFYRRKCRINAGALNNVAVTEVCMKNGSTLFNRALIKDEQGNPTSITVQSDEYLDVTGEVRMYFNTELHSGSFNLTDRDNNLIRVVSYTGRFARVASSARVDSGVLSSNVYLGIEGYSGGISEGISGKPSGTQLFYSNDYRTYFTYVAGSHTLRLRLILPLNAANVQPIKSFLIICRAFQYQFELDEPITKTADEMFTAFFNFKWGRYTGVIE